MQLALTDLFKARWTDQIHEEWIEALLRRGKYDRNFLEKTRDTWMPVYVIPKYLAMKNV